ncbi:MAG: beta-propeller fold lactonase family protein [Bacteroidota bacterium]
MSLFKQSSTFFIAFILLTFSAFSQISYLEKIFHHQDGIYGLVGPRSICFSPDKKNIYVSSEYSLTVFSYNEVSGETVLLEVHKNNTDGITGLENTAGVLASPDGKYVYTSSEGQNCVTQYRRLEDTGLLEFMSVYYDNENGNEGLRGVHGMAFTDSGEYMYFAAWNDAKISTYQRDTITGIITHLQSINQYDPGGMTWPAPIKLSKDNRFAYVSSIMEDAVSVFELNQNTGLLTFIQKTEYISGLNYPQGIEISHDDAYLYLVCKNSLVIFERDILDGTLSFKEIFLSDDFDGLKGSYSLTTTPDDKNIYTISHEGTSFVTFSRDPGNNDFEYVQTQHLLDPWLSNAQYSNTAMISDNNYVFGTSYWEKGIHKTERSQLTGNLSHELFIHEGMGATINGLYNPAHCCSDHNNKNIYVTTHYNGISIFNRNDTSGVLTYKNVVDNQSIGSGQLRYAKKSMISLDDKYLYTIAGPDLNANILIFEIDHANETLILKDSLNADHNGIEELRGVKDLCMSNDKQHVYVVSSFSHGVLQFEYDPQDGTLDFVTFFNYVSHGSSFDQIILSKNGEFVFIGSSLNSDLLMLGRDTQSGALVFLSEYSKILPGGHYAYGLAAMDVSNDNKNLYAIYENSDMLVNYNIDPINDSLYVMQVFDYEEHQIDGLLQIDRLVLRNDETFVYTTSRENHSLGLFYRNPLNGMLTFVNDFTETEWNFDGLDGVTWMCIPPNDRNLYLTSDYEEGIASYKIDLYLGPDLTICEGDTALLDAGQGYASYLWSTNETTRQIKAIEEGLYIVETIDSFGFHDTDSLYLNVSPLPVADLGADIDACEGDTVLLDAGTGGIILWNTGSTSRFFAVAESGEYSVLVSNENQCSNRDTVIVSFHEGPEVDLGNDTTISTGQTMILSVGYKPYYTYLWHNGSTDTLIEIESGSLDSNSLIAWIRVTDYYGCSSSDSIKICREAGVLFLRPVIKVKPVPSRQYVYIESNYAITEVKCYDMAGKMIFTSSCHSQNCRLNLERLARGQYLLRIRLINGAEQTHEIIRI